MRILYARVSKYKQVWENMIDNHRIQFERPNLAELKKENTVVDLHFHSHYSDGFNTVEAIARKAHDLGIGIAVTDHNEIRGAVEIDEYRGIFSIPGIEMTSREGTHVLIYFYHIETLEVFYNDHVIPYMGNDIMSSTSLEMEEIIKRARKFKTVIIFPHPFCGVYTGIQNSYFPEDRLERVLSEVDGVEVINSENMNKSNLRSALLGFNLGKGITGGSDGHRVSQMGRVVTYASCKRSRKAFLDAIKKKKTKVIGKEIDLIRKVTSNGVKLRNNIRNYPDLVEKNLKYSYKVINSKSKEIKENVKRSLNGKK
ncbi:MAG: PHP domain-containing protein, partial [Desulfobacterales bacterium]|nr:PHP domain-containing protein [Desulfobacterales bacterium]